MSPVEPHIGIAADDPRNAGPIAYFRPKPVTRESLRAQLSPYRTGKALDARIDEVMARLARTPVRPDPPLSQPLEAAPDPWFGLSTHPDLVEQLWKLDDSLPVRCRWLLWGRPALVHPASGVIFAVGFGSIGLVIRLPEAVRAVASDDEAAAVVKGNPGQSFDIGPAGPEWRFLRPRAPTQAWARAAYDFAAP